MVTQNSKIQVRSGLKQNLPLLSQGEFGWCVDSLELFIGNGNVQSGAPYQGNTEIATIADLQDFTPEAILNENTNPSISPEGFLLFGPNDTQLDANTLGLTQQIESYCRFVTTDNPTTPIGLTGITNISISTNILTVIVPNSLSTGNRVEFVFMSPATFLNGVIVKIKNATSSQFTADFNYVGNYGPASDDGTIFLKNGSLEGVSMITQTDPSIANSNPYTLGASISAVCTASANFTPISLPSVFPEGITGLFAGAYHVGTATISGSNYGLIGIQGQVQNFNGGSLDTVATCVLDIGNNNGAHINNAYNLFLTSNGDTDGTITNSYSIYVSLQKPASSTKRWAIYEQNAIDNNVMGPLYLGGNTTGTATITNPSTNVAVTFTNPFIGSTAPIVQLTPTSDPNSLGGYWVTTSGSGGNWTGFIVNVHTAPTSNVIFNYTAVSTDAGT